MSALRINRSIVVSDLPAPTAHWMVLAAVLLLALWAPGCGACPKAVAESAGGPGAELPEGDSAPDDVPGEPVSRAAPGGELGEVNADMVGLWRRFWSPQGEAKTERFLFLADGRWGWRAVEEENGRPGPCVLRRSGHWGWRDGMVVIAEHEREESAACARGHGRSGEPAAASPGAAEGGEVHPASNAGHAGSGCPCSKRPHGVVRPSFPSVQHLPVGECPPNQEAEHLDAGYVCRSIGGRVFWRQSSAPDVDSSPFVGAVEAGDRGAGAQ